jgi:two-component system chemotaxis response regulator CheB
MIRVLVVDDSATVRQVLREVLSSDPELEVMGTASDPLVAAQQIAQEVPDVIILDIEMPRMDGLTFLDRIMEQHPIPVVICSTLTERGSESALDALDRGAVEVLAKPKLGTRQFLEDARIQICGAVKAAAQVKPRRLQRIEARRTADAILAKEARALRVTTEKVVAIGASTGGTDAIARVLSALPMDAPGVVVVQHMPENFTAQFARRLDGLCEMCVKEAVDGDSLLRGHVLIAPGGKHLLLRRSGARYFVEVRDGPLVARHRPSVDVLFRSTARYAGRNAVGVLLTGMGDDGAQGLLELRQAGAHTIAQDEASSVVYGMPREAAKLGAVEAVLPLGEVAPAILRWV